MLALVPEVHLFICLDSKVSAGPVLQILDFVRAKSWQQETVLLCDISWKKHVNIDQPVLYIDRSKLFQGSVSENAVVNTVELDQLLEQLDSFEINQVTKIGELSWGRWVQVYLEQTNSNNFNEIHWNSKDVTSIQVMNEVSAELGLDLSLPSSEKSKSSAVYIDPYENNEVSSRFIDLFQNQSDHKVPEWVRVICKEEDMALLVDVGLEDALVDAKETEMSLFNQYVLCFSDQSRFAVTSRSYNVALYSCESDQSLFVQGDIKVHSEVDIHFSELLNILSYWKANRLKELSFQWMNMGIEIETVELFHSRIVKRNLLNYSSDLYNCQFIVNKFTNHPEESKKSGITEMIRHMRNNINNDPYSLSFSLKILIMITERMLASAACGERLFQRLGSDYHRIIIGEALLEVNMGKNQKKIKEFDFEKQLKCFLKFLTEIDFKNDQVDSILQNKEF